MYPAGSCTWGSRSQAAVYRALFSSLFSGRPRKEKKISARCVRWQYRRLRASFRMQLLPPRRPRRRLHRRPPHPPPHPPRPPPRPPPHPQDLALARPRAPWVARRTARPVAWAGLGTNPVATHNKSTNIDTSGGSSACHGPSPGTAP